MAGAAARPLALAMLALAAMLGGVRAGAPKALDSRPRTYVRVTLGKTYDQPVYVHILADHYRDPWYSHHYLSKAGCRAGLQPPAGDLLAGGQQTPWCDLTPMLYPQTGAILDITVRRSYWKRQPRLKAKIEFATAPDASAIVRTMDVDSTPGGLVIDMPPDLATAEHRDLLKRDLECAEATGRLADRYPWPTVGRKPERFPFFVSVVIGGYGTPVDQAVTDRELKTLGYFGFSNGSRYVLGGGTWHMLEKSCCQPDLKRIRAAAATRAEQLAKDGKTAADVTFCRLMDEPAGQRLDFMASNAAYQTAFRAWLRQQGLKPADLLLADWDAVRTVTAEQRDTAPALYYFSQRFRTRALGEFLAVQRRALEAACKGTFPVLVNFSDGAIYYANFYGQGVDYFELLADDSQNAIWSEDWANGASTYQCAAYNVELMRSAARQHGQVLGHFLIAYAGRKPLDVKLKAAGEAARGVKIFESFAYGVYWGTHEGGPAWRSSAWQARPETWGDYAAIVREIGAAEDLLVPAMPVETPVAMLYSASSDVWQIGVNGAFGFDRMHTWLALAHAQVPVDILSERQVAAGELARYRVCYLAGPNLTRAAAGKLAEWVRAGGVLVASAGAGSRDEYNRPLATIDPLLPADRGELATPRPFRSSGRYLTVLEPQDKVAAGPASTDVLSVKQALKPRAGATVLGTYRDGSAAWLRGRAGRGIVYYAGFLPSLAYIRQALLARQTLAKQLKADPEKLAAADRARLAGSYNPWAYPPAIREALVGPVRAAGVELPVTCSVPLVDAVCMGCEEGLIVPLANYTLSPLGRIDLTVRTARPVARVESVWQGKLAFHQQAGRVSVSLPLASTDYLKLYYRPG